MDRTAEVLLESWNRQAEIVNRLAGIVDENVLNAKPSEDGWTIGFHLCHMHGVRKGWLSEISPSHAESLESLIEGGWQGTPSSDLRLIRAELRKSGEAVGTAFRDLMSRGVERIAPYDHPVHFLEHMVWHDGWHYGLIALALRLAGKELDEEWEERNVWGIWRDPEV